MTIEEKARAYDEVLERVKPLYEWAKKDDSPMWSTYEYLFPQLAESEDERTRREIIDFIQWAEDRGMTRHDYHQAKRPAVWIAYLEKQKDANKAIEAVERIDKYIDEHLANAHDMKDSDSDKKYYRGLDDALGKMAGILQDVYSGEKKKESLRDFIDDFPYSDEQKEPHFTKRNALFDKCVENCDPEVMKKVSDEIDEMLQKEQKPNFDTHWENGSVVYEQKEQKPLNFTQDEIHMLDVVIDIFEDTESLSDDKDLLKGLYNIRSKILKYEQEEQKHPNGCFTCDEYKKGYEEGRSNGFTAGYNKAMKEQKPVEVKDPFSNANFVRGYESGYADAKREQKPAEWSEADEEKLKAICTYLRDYSRLAKLDDKLRFNEYCDFLESLRPSWKPSEHQMTILKAVKEYVGRGSGYWGEALGSLIEDLEKLM